MDILHIINIIKIKHILIMLIILYKITNTLIYYYRNILKLTIILYAPKILVFNNKLCFIVYIYYFLSFFTKSIIYI